jgi:hypothetical protein
VGKIRGNYGNKWDNPNITFKWWKHAGILVEDNGS